MIPTRALTLARTRQWTIREVLQGREVPMSNEEARIRMGNYPTKWHASIAEPAGPAFGQRALQRPPSHQPERAAGCLRLRRASAHEPLWSQPCWPATAFAWFATQVRQAYAEDADQVDDLQGETKALHVQRQAEQAGQVYRALEVGQTWYMLATQRPATMHTLCHHVCPPRGALCALCKAVRAAPALTLW